MRQLLPEPIDGPDLHALYAAGWVDRGGVRANFVTSVDGAVHVDGGSRGLQTAPDQRVFAVLRDLADVVLVGRGTAVTENYPALATSPRRAAVRAAYGLGPTLPTAVVSASLDLDPAAALFDYSRGAPRTILITTERGRRARPALGNVADVVVAGDETLDLPSLLGVLREHGLTRILTEGGPRLLATLLAAGMVDEFCHTVVPRLVGSDAALLPGPLATPSALTRLSLLEQDATLLHRYRVARR